MVAPIENLTLLVGAITERIPHPELRGWDLVALSVDGTHSVPGKADLLSARRDDPLPVAVRRELLGDAPVGSRLQVRARMTVNGAIAEAYPKAGDLRVDQP